MELSGPTDEPIVPPKGGAAEPGCSVLEGPPHQLGLSWALSVNGAEYVALLLWIGKDWSWSQLGWTTAAFFFGTCAAVWIFGMTYYAYSCRLYSEFYKGVVVCLWLIGLYAWMVGEFWTLWYTEGVTGQHALVFEEIGNTIAKWVLLAAAFLYAVFFAVLVPLDVFKSDRQSVILARMEAKSPPCPQWAVGYCREFRIYSSVHFFTWVLKDALWAWEQPIAYGIAFVATVLLNVDLLWRFGTHRDQYIDFVNYLAILFWVMANGLWAFGELVANTDATEDQFRQYSWPQWQVIHGTSFQFRYSAGWMFLLSGLCLFAFYVHWIFVTGKKKLPSYEDFEKIGGCDDNVLC